MTAPLITIQAVTKTRISRKSGADVSTVTFTADQDLVDWEVRADGAGVGQGLLVGKAQEVRDTFGALEALGWTFADIESRGLTWGNFAVVVPVGNTATFDVDDEELTQGDRTYRINVYGKNKAGEWTPYG